MEPKDYLDLNVKDSQWLRQMSLQNAQMALEQAKLQYQSHSIDLKDIYDTLSKRINGGTDSLYADLDAQIAKVNGIKPIQFKNPEKLNGKIDSRGESYEIQFVGRSLTLKEDNWTWEIRGIKSGAPYGYENTLSILKYPKREGYATMITDSYGQTKTTEVILDSLYNMNFMIQQLISLTELPF
jgi:hypothetical protein